MFPAEPLTDQMMTDFLPIKHLGTKFHKIQIKLWKPNFNHAFKNIYEMSAISVRLQYANLHDFCTPLVNLPVGISLVFCTEYRE